MKNFGRILLFSLLLLHFQKDIAAQQNGKQKLVIITLDGFRWREFFGGADSVLLFSAETGKKDSAKVVADFWAGTQTERRNKLLPFFWSGFVPAGQAYGNRNLQSNVNVKNRYWFSYPGYNEILTGYADTLINSNRFPDNPNVNLLEFINQQPQYKNKVAAFTSWGAFTRILNKERSGIPVNAGFAEFQDAHLTDVQKTLNVLQLRLPKSMSPDERPDGITYYMAKEYIKANHPKVVQISFTETDAFAHDNQYIFYLNSARNCDAMINDLWNYLQSDPFYRGQVSFFITTDHGRGEGPKWKGHNSSTPGSDQIWFAVRGPHVKPLGETKNQQCYQNQFAKTMAALIGLRFTSIHEIGDIISNVTGD